MIAKCPCEHCGVNIEFATEEFLSGNSVKCPECGKETTLYVSPQAKPAPRVESAYESQPPPTSPAPDSNSSKNLRVCKDCGKNISVHAEFCPHCGATSKKRHGVFFYVFWSVISLIATGIILTLVWIFLVVGLGVGIPAFIKARNNAQARNDAQSSQGSTNTTQSLDSQKSDYMINNLILYDCSSDYHDSLIDGRVLGVEFKIKNKGNRTLRKVEVTFYFKDSSGQTISEEKYYPVLVTEFGTDNNPLKPGYIWQMERGHFYAAKKVPSEWQPRNTTAQITDIEFEK